MGYGLKVMDSEEKRREPDIYLWRAFSGILKPIAISMAAIDVVLYILAIWWLPIIAAQVIAMGLWLASATVFWVCTTDWLERCYKSSPTYELSDPDTRKKKLFVMFYCWPFVLTRIAANPKYWHELRFKVKPEFSLRPANPMQDEIEKLETQLYELDKLADTPMVQCAKESVRNAIEEAKLVGELLWHDTCDIKALAAIGEADRVFDLAGHQHAIQQELMQEYHGPQIEAFLNGQKQIEAIKEPEADADPKAKKIKPIFPIKNRTIIG